MNKLLRIAALGALLTIAALPVRSDEAGTDTRPGIAPDIRGDESELTLERGNLVVAPIPISNPTLGTGLVAVAAYFYAQSEEQEKVQPASVTGLAAMYTSNDSKAIAIAQQNYWSNNNWRFTGAIGAADFRLPLLAPDQSPSGQSVDWQIDGGFALARLSRKILGDWYGGAFTRLIDADQTIQTGSPESGAGIDLGNVRAVGLGVTFEYDTRDMPGNAYSGRYLKVEGLFNDERIGSQRTYQNYSIAFRSYHELSESLVLAWEAQGCNRAGQVPLWDACRISLRGFATTDYLAKVTASAQVEARWRLSKRWGLVGFGGAGYASTSFSDVRENEPIPSYGVGLRFSVLPAKRVNMRLDYARSTKSDAIHFSVGEAF